MATMNMCAMDIIAFEKLLVDRNIRTNIELAERCGIDRNTACSALPENTSLQKNVKNHLLSGGVIRNAYGRLR